MPGLARESRPSVFLTRFSRSCHYRIYGPSTPGVGKHLRWRASVVLEWTLAQELRPPGSMYQTCNKP